MNILLGLTGSVASTLYMKLIEEFSKLGNVDVILTENAKKFANPQILLQSKARTIYVDEDEWYIEDGVCEYRKWRKGDPILHIELRRKAAALVIAPCSANTLAKISGGICDNLLTSVVRAWDLNRPWFIAPAMNTHMWNHPITNKQLSEVSAYGCNVIYPQSKKLACGDNGIGALADIDKIVDEVRQSLKWSFPLERCSGIPVTPHPGAFKAVRRDNHVHTGVDLYTDEGQPIRACESGTIVSIEPFTGAKDGSPWWKDTDAILIEGASGVICYGELEPSPLVNVGMQIQRGDVIGRVKRVILEGKERPEITGWKPSMLHMELYPHGTTKASDGYINARDLLQDPTPYLLKSIPPFCNHGVLQELMWEPPKA